MYLVYKCTNTINGKIYIGITERDIKSRFVNHVSEAFNPNSDKYNTPFKQAIRKYGIDNFTIDIINTAKTVEAAWNLEKQYIREYNSYCYQKNSNGYNATLGGDGCSKPIRDIVQVDTNTYEIVGTYRSIAEAERILNIGHISECLPDRIPSSGGYCWFDAGYYNSLTIQQQQDLVNLKLKRIVQMDKNHSIIKVWNSALEASRCLNISDSNIVSCYKGARKSSGGFIWRTYEDYINNTTPSYTREKIYKRDEHLNILNSYETIKDAGAHNNIIPQVLGRHINTGELYLGYFWNKEAVI